MHAGVNLNSSHLLTGFKDVKHLIELILCGIFKIESGSLISRHHRALSFQGALVDD